MSGSDGPPSGGMFNGGPDGDDCAALRIDDLVAAPDPSHTFIVGSLLDVELSTAPLVTILLVSRGVRVGALHPYPALVRCLTAGVRFQAEVTSARGGDIRVRVEPAP